MMSIKVVPSVLLSSGPKGSAVRWPSVLSLPKGEGRGEGKGNPVQPTRCELNTKVPTARFSSDQTLITREQEPDWWPQRNAGPALTVTGLIVVIGLLLWSAPQIFGADPLPGAVRKDKPVDPFSEFVRSTPPLTPQEERQAFHVPDGFEVQLFAAEPEVGKPMNMAFDGRGRLWVAQSREYPFPVKPGTKGRDEIRVLEDTDGDGRADKVTVFAEGLNIPIGLYPYKNGVIALSVPNISFYQDTDGDGRADKVDQVLGPIGFEKDTHGMVASFRRGFDGWIYATHGFNNTTTLRGRDGSSITMNSGNTWRFRPDGERVEQWTHGQVNPFGLMFDPRGSLYSADCHSSPIYQLLHGAYYPSFGKPDDGLGFAPTMMKHSHGSTAIGGIVYYAADGFPAEFRDNIFVGNVMTCRVNRDTLEPHGTTLLAKEAPDFLRCDDPWFRPVDLQLGPDGALYVADFYNRIIGHYEVPLTHPGRDHDRGRIWRVVYKGTGKRPPDLTKASVRELIQELAAPNHTCRMLALDQLSDRIGAKALPEVRAMLKSSKNPEQKAYGLWLLHRLGQAESADYTRLVKDASPLVRLHAVTAASELPNQHSKPADLILPAVKDPDAFVQRAAAYGAARVTDGSSVPALLQLRRSVPSDDTHLLYVARMALRDAVQQPAKQDKTVLDAWREKDLSEADSRALADVAAAITNTSAAAFLLHHLERYSEPRETITRYLRHAVRYLPADQIDTLAKLARKQFQSDSELQFSLFKSVQEGLAQRGVKLTPGAKEWGRGLAEKLLQSVENTSNSWVNTPLEGTKNPANPWTSQQRTSNDGDSQSLFLCSLPKGEQLTGRLRSQPFSIPPQLSFFMAGHDGFPDKPAQKKNYIQLRLVGTDEALLTAYPPRNDTARRVKWDLKAAEKDQYVGKKGYLEIVDGDEGTAYAWLAVGRFSPSLVTVPADEPGLVAKRQAQAADLARLLPAPELEPGLRKLVANPAAAGEARLAAGKALLTFHPNDEVGALVDLLAETAVPEALRQAIAETFNTKGSPDLLLQAMKILPHRFQAKVAQSLAGSTSGSETLLKLVRQGTAPAGLLRERSIKEKLLATRPENAKQIEELTRNLSSSSEQAQKLIDKRRTAFTPSRASATKGEQLFTQHCRACHQIDAQGGLIGPQLDGVGNRGLERLCEDVLDPNRSVDHAFRTTLIVLKDGDVLSGLFRREEGETIVLADATGKENSVPKKAIQEKKQTESSLMPENFGELLTQEDFNNLMAFLLTKGLKK